MPESPASCLNGLTSPIWKSYSSILSIEPTTRPGWLSQLRTAPRAPGKSILLINLIDLHSPTEDETDS